MLRLAIFIVLGLSAVTASPVVGPQIVGGENATQDEFPFVVSLQDYGTHFCAGSFISDQWVLTAAHCMKNNTQVYYGKTMLRNSHGDYPNYINVSKYIPHPNYTNEVGFLHLFVRNDLALLKLEHPVNFTANVQPIKLPQQNETVPKNHSATLVGWGNIDGWYSQTKILQKVNLTIYNDPYCDLYNGFFNFDNVQNICAGNDNNTKGQCNGDSGGPLFVDGVQWGIVSWSVKPCVIAPGVFTSTSVFIDWINSVMASN